MKSPTKYLFVVAFCVSLVLAGCGGSAPQPTPPPTAKPAAPAPSAPAATPAPAPAPAAAPTPAPATPAKQAGKATLYRDTWGIPHAYADTMPEAAFALGYAQAEDRLDDLYLNVRTALGRTAEIKGEEAVQDDYIMQLSRNAEVCENYWKTAPEELRAIGDNFMRGVQAYLADHPEVKSPYALELHGWQCAAVGRAMILDWPMGTIMGDLENKKNAPGFGSNSFAVAPSRSADGSAILMTDPHLTWQGMAVFYESRIHAGNVNACGFSIVGSPLPALGHSANVAWACTTGGPDTSDVYMVKLNPENPMQYQYNGEWKTFEARSITINVKDKDPVVKPALYSVYGPVVEEPDPKKGIAYCGASPYLEATGLFEQTLRMAQARSGDEFYKALGMNQYMEQNISFADTDGHIRYVRNGCVPIRPDGYKWDAPVPGGTDASRWLGIHKIEDLVQVQDPPQGYFQNCNCSPAVMMKDSPLTPDKYKDYLYNVSWDKQSPRGARLRELLDADDQITREEAMDYTLNVYDLLSKPWQKALKTAVDALGKARMEDAVFAKAVNDILAWNGEFSTDSVAAPVVKFWRLKCEKLFNVAAIAEDKPLGVEDQNKMLEALATTLAELKQKYGTLDIKWGDINLIGRDGKFYPCGGADFGDRGKKNYTQTVMVVGVSEKPEGSGKYVGRKGSSTIMLSFCKKDGIESYSLLNWGISADPNSPHHVDQSEKLYSQRKFKPTWFKKEDLLKNLESEKTLVVP